jgi:antitoxin component YwqK of YwqJK toxin-antitoxin module
MISHFNSEGRLAGEADTYIKGKIKSKEFFRGGKRDEPDSVYYQSGQIELKSFQRQS